VINLGLEPLLEFEVTMSMYHSSMFDWCLKNFEPLTWELHLTIDDFSGDDGAIFKFLTQEQAVMFSLVDFSSVGD
jgi:hypothetical protein